MKASKTATKIIGENILDFYLLFHACDDRSPVLVARVTLGELVVVIPRQHALQVSNNRALFVGIGSGKDQELRARILGVRFRCWLAGDQQLLSLVTLPRAERQGNRGSRYRENVRVGGI